MKRFKMGVLNNFQTHKIYATNRKIIYREKIKPPKPPEPTPPNPFAKPPSKPFVNIPKPNLPKP